MVTFELSVFKASLPLHGTGKLFSSTASLYLTYPVRVFEKAFPEIPIPLTPFPVNPLPVPLLLFFPPVMHALHIKDHVSTYNYVFVAKTEMLLAIIPTILITLIC